MSYLCMILRGKDERSSPLEYTGLCGGLEHLKIETRLRRRLSDERFESVKGVSRSYSRVINI
jgi:hypothetical protein